MLKTLLLLICDTCGQQFLYARSSEANKAPSFVDAAALTAMASEKTYRWTIIRDGKQWYHYCPECSCDYSEPQM